MGRLADTGEKIAKSVTEGYRKIETDELPK